MLAQLTCAQVEYVHAAGGGRHQAVLPVPRVTSVPAGQAAHKLPAHHVHQVPLVRVDEPDDGGLVREGHQPAHVLEAGVLEQDLVEEGARLVAVHVEVGLELLEAEADQELLVGRVDDRQELPEGELEGKVELGAGEALGDDEPDLRA